LTGCSEVRSCVRWWFSSLIKNRKKLRPKEPLTAVDESRPTILVADDDQVRLGMMASVLGRDNRFRVLTAQDGE
jgi:hypothetical protein